MEFFNDISGITVAVVIFAVFLLITGLLVGSILVALRKSKSQKVDDAPVKETAEFQRDTEVDELEKRDKEAKHRP